MSITALLGPTNTGKTHRAVERMLEHASGMIGLPLRLLAREVYDSVSARVGESAVALVTGEERRVPARPSYWVATVEAMPVERTVDFLAVDEIQLAAHEQRGHVFTERVLNARGRLETWFLGAATMRGVLGELAPTAHVAEHPRLSRLTFAGSVPLQRLPPRSAMVAFSSSHVYELAERIRARRGGAAVVLGALSPRTRNAQVAMFQAGEVDHLVATDAIGMGLNLGVTHVAFAALRKFDGRGPRPLEEAELGQIAGRAGRWIQDGTFGTLAPLELPLGTARQIEEHRFAPVRRVRWRNADLDFTSVDALLASLEVRPTRGVLQAAAPADDLRALLQVIRRDAVRVAAKGFERVRLLWDACSVPDYKKLLLEVHADFVAELFLQLVAGPLPDDWVRQRVRGLDDTSGDVDTLLARIASTRTWTYVTQRAEWLASPGEWGPAMREVEDRLSDALHARLVQRFVDVKRTRPLRARAPALRARPDVPPPRPPPSHPFAALEALRGKLPVESSPALADERAWIEPAIEAVHVDLRLERSGHIVHVPSGRLLGELVRGASLVLPEARLLLADEEGQPIGAGARSRLQRRLLAFARDVVAELVGPLRDAARAGSATLRGLVYQLEQRLGSAAAVEIADALAALTAADAEQLGAAGLVLGPGAVYLPGGLLPAQVDARIALAAAHHGPRARAALSPPPGGAVSFDAARGLPAAAYAAVGHPLFGRRAIRADIAARTAAWIESGAPRPEAGEIANHLGCPRRSVDRVLEDLLARPRRLVSQA